MLVIYLFIFNKLDAEPTITLHLSLVNSKSLILIQIKKPFLELELKYYKQRNFLHVFNNMIYE